ncbi:two-component system, LytT family, sensor histidine kinase AlgZ [Collimonas sp. OK307]|uniref:sensor histidine kinase n=1 Tax=Collimonas sp. OK307 TaxID=1801620 RepID=UPI0008E2FCDF|nr:histidine kinase [Collimonas sp. OK307]SFI26127.1 two-component system, LytT family, sensor histidine kinase AlgZ [Collimonas sp. OK307]
MPNDQIADTAQAQQPNTVVIPDGCNLGVVFRALIAVNLAVMVALLLHSDSVMAALNSFVESAMLIEPACFLSLSILCGLHRLADRFSLFMQRVSCWFVPALVTIAVIRLLSGFDWFLSGFSHLSATGGIPLAAFVAALFGGALQHYFELRAKAFSPVLVEARLQALQARIRPHFLFNSLNAVLSLIRTEPRRAEAALEDLADLIRVLMRDGRAMTTLEKEIRLCRQYLSIEKIRLGERLKVQWERAGISDEVIFRAQIPTLLLQPLIENAVHYGVEPSSEPALIRIQLSHSLERIEIIITNPYNPYSGKGVAALPEGNQMALENIRERLSLLYDVEAQLTTTTKLGQFEVRASFPYVKAALVKQ